MADGRKEGLTLEGRGRTIDGFTEGRILEDRGRTKLEAFALDGRAEEARERLLDEAFTDEDTLDEALDTEDEPTADRLADLMLERAIELEPDALPDEELDVAADENKTRELEFGASIADEAAEDESELGAADFTDETSGMEDETAVELNTR
jgi:hypothetical protein